MPSYEIEQYEISSSKYRVTANSEAQAIKKLLDGEADAVEGSTEFIEVAEECGLPVDEYQELAEELRDLGVSFDEIIPSIRRIEVVSD